MSHTTMPTAFHVCDSSRSAKIFKSYRSTRKNHPRVYVINTRVRDPPCGAGSAASEMSRDPFNTHKITAGQLFALGESDALTTLFYYRRGFSIRLRISRLITRVTSVPLGKSFVYRKRSRLRVIFRHPSRPRVMQFYSAAISRLNSNESTVVQF